MPQLGKEGETRPEYSKKVLEPVRKVVRSRGMKLLLVIGIGKGGGIQRGGGQHGNGIGGKKIRPSLIARGQWKRGSSRASGVAYWPEGGSPGKVNV